MSTCQWADWYMEDEKGDWKVKELDDWFQHIDDDDDQSDNDDEEEETQRLSPTTVITIVRRHRMKNHPMGRNAGCNA